MTFTRRQFFATLLAPFLSKIGYRSKPATRMVKARQLGNTTLNTQYIEWYFSQSPMFQFGFTGYRGLNGHDV